MVFQSVTLAAKSLGVDRANIFKVLAGIISRIHGYKFEYVPVPDLEGEVWKKHPRLDVELSTMGRCRTEKTNPSYGCLQSDGYRTKAVGKKSYKIHRLIAETFLDLPNGKRSSIASSKAYQVDHIDMDRSNNKLSNLRWATQSENIRSSYAKNKDRKSCSEVLSKPIKCLNTGMVFQSVTLAAKSLGVDRANIFKVLRGKLSHAGGFKFEYVPVPDLEGEVWKKHPRLDVELSTMGRCRSKRMNASHGCLLRTGYRSVQIHHKTYKVHRLVAETFLPLPDVVSESEELDDSDYEQELLEEAEESDESEEESDEEAYQYYEYRKMGGKHARFLVKQVGGGNYQESDHEKDEPYYFYDKTTGKWKMKEDDEVIECDATAPEELPEAEVISEDKRQKYDEGGVIEQPEYDEYGVILSPGNKRKREELPEAEVISEDKRQKYDEGGVIEQPEYDEYGVILSPGNKRKREELPEAEVVSDLVM